ncbi:hypothetical protein B0H63DRAFT_531928 [Podospora didyma]|uniref:Uncharacterized protein n=1 Tax=Podospora didyma TaxID=330526 RepID=A0AAE0P5U6_9PEZI|nr:hypothetical protein B0H63DRAFT_531928 [Podospora didyma]
MNRFHLLHMAAVMTTVGAVAAIPSSSTGRPNSSISETTPPDPRIATEHGSTPLFHYSPSFDLAFTSVVVFAGLGVAHAWLAFKTRSMYFLMTAAAGIIMTAGMIIRLVFASVPADNNGSYYWPFAFMSVLITMPGSILGVTLIMTYTRLTWWITPAEHRTLGELWLPPAYQTILLAGSQAVADSLTFLGSGTFLIRPGPPHLAAAGAVLDMLTWIVLASLAVRFVYVGRRRWAPIEKDVQRGLQELGPAVCFSTVLLVIRGVTQVLERDVTALLTAVPPPDPMSLPIMATEEWPVYVFDFLLIAVILLAMAVYHPGLYFPRRLTGFRLQTKALVREEEEGMGGSDATLVEKSGSIGWSTAESSTPTTSGEAVNLEKVSKP